jgi:hypothetical protein
MRFVVPLSWSQRSTRLLPKLHASSCERVMATLNIAQIARSKHLVDRSRLDPEVSLL